MLTSPGIYYGTNEQGETITVRAQDANDYINPQNVLNAINNIDSIVTEELKKITDALQPLGAEIDTAIVVKDKKMEQTVDDICIAIMDSAKYFDAISGLYNDAVEAHNNLQQQLNNEAQACASRVSESANVKEATTL